MEQFKPKYIQQTIPLADLQRKTPKERIDALTASVKAMAITYAESMNGIFQEKNSPEAQELESGLANILQGKQLGGKQKKWSRFTRKQQKKRTVSRKVNS